MGHIGNTVQTAFTTFDKQTITGTGTSVYTLSHNVANEQEIEVFVNNVRQEGGSGKAYTVSGNQITFTENIASTDTVYVNFQGKAVQTVSHPSDQPMQATTGTFSSNVDVGGSLLVDTIKEGTGTNTAMTIDSSGRITPSVPVYGHFRHNGVTYSLGSVATLVKLTLDDTYAQSGGFSLANNEVTVPMTGRYRWSVAIQLNCSAARRAVSFVVYRNGSIDVQNQFTHFAFPYVSGTTHNMLTVSNLISCTAGDDISLYLREYDNNSMTVRVDHFTMDFIG